MNILQEQCICYRILFGIQSSSFSEVKDEKNVAHKKCSAQVQMPPKNVVKSISLVKWNQPTGQFTDVIYPWQCWGSLSSPQLMLVVWSVGSLIAVSSAWPILAFLSASPSPLTKCDAIDPRDPNLVALAIEMCQSICRTAPASICMRTWDRKRIISKLLTEFFFIWFDFYFILFSCCCVVKT